MRIHTTSSRRKFWNKLRLVVTEMRKYKKFLTAGRRLKPRWKLPKRVIRLQLPARAARRGCTSPMAKRYPGMREKQLKRLYETYILRRCQNGNRLQLFAGVGGRKNSD